MQIYIIFMAYRVHPAYVQLAIIEYLGSLMMISSTQENNFCTNYGMFLLGKPPSTYLELPQNDDYVLGYPRNKLQMKP